MKNLLLITVFVVAITTNLMAQDKGAIRINHLQQRSLGTKTSVQKENHQFEIVAKEEVDVNLKFSLKAEDNLNIVVTDQDDKVILTKKFRKKGENRLAFTMNENEKYIVKLAGEKQSNLIVNVSED
jgi:alpha-glucosidase (family GH31 glycosyl hydrolase)